ncbi:MAG: S9 family peptidase [Hyphomonas sp.]|nr:S9 family peptidase [Hyphomonas sp.]
MRRLAALLILVFCAALAPRPASAQTPAAPPPSLEDFLSETDFWNPELSPSGQFLAGVLRNKGEDMLVIMDLDNPEAQTPAQSLEDMFVNWIEWTSDDRILVALSGYMNIALGRQMTREEIETWTDKSRAIPRRFTRLISIDRKTREGAAMFGDSNRMANNFSLGSVVDFLPDDPEHILMPARLNGDLDLFKVNVADGSFERVALGTGNTYAWYTDRNGEPAFRLNINDRGTIAFVFAREDKQNGKIKWRKVRTIRLNDDSDSRAALDFKILFPGPTATTYYVSARPEGEEFAGIYLYDFEKDELLDPVRVSDRLDIEDGFFNPDTKELQGIYYFDDRLVIEMNDEKTDTHLKALNAYFNNEANVIPMDSSRDGNRWLIMATGPREPVSYHVYDVDTATAIQIGFGRFRLEGKSFGATQVVEYAARDGLALRGYLTRPANVAEGTNPPLVVMPHGGPEQRDYFDYDRDVQILVSKGYQVFQPNFRGSAGYGKSFVEKGHGQWGRAMQSDIDDGYDHLVAAGLADADRACIFGYSYGGYAALAAATLTPEKYNCIIAGAGISDLVKFLERERREEGRESEVYEVWSRRIGNLKTDKASIKAVSPADHADRVVRPLLIIHGKEDGIVDYEQAKIMAKALDKAGKPYKLVTLKESSHRYMPEDEELTYYNEIIDFLNQNLPVN